METAAEQQVTKTIDYFQEIWPALKVWGINLLVTLLILIIGLYLIKAVMKALDKAARQANADVTLARFMHSFVNIALYILLIFIVAGQLGINTASILAVLGTAGLAIAMSLKDSLSHFAGGILIFDGISDLWVISRVSKAHKEMEVEATAVDVEAAVTEQAEAPAENAGSGNETPAAEESAVHQPPAEADPVQPSADPAESSVVPEYMEQTEQDTDFSSFAGSDDPKDKQDEEKAAE